jgi:hypothetical protein
LGSRFATGDDDHSVRGGLAVSWFAVTFEMRDIEGRLIQGCMET